MFTRGFAAGAGAARFGAWPFLAPNSDHSQLIARSAHCHCLVDGSRQEALQPRAFGRHAAPIISAMEPVTTTLEDRVERRMRPLHGAFRAAPSKFSSERPVTTIGIRVRKRRYNAAPR